MQLEEDAKPSNISRWSGISYYLRSENARCAVLRVFLHLFHKNVSLIDKSSGKKKHVCFEGFFLKKKNSLVFTSFWWLKPFTNKKRREGVYRMWSSYLKHQSSSFSKVWGRSGVKVNTEPLTMRSRLLPKNDGKNVVFLRENDRKKWCGKKMETYLLLKNGEGI